jgi:hypothetical protein
VSPALVLVTIRTGVQWDLLEEAYSGEINIEQLRFGPDALEIVGSL